jgi:hypothetical protein
MLIAAAVLAAATSPALACPIIDANKVTKMGQIHHAVITFPMGTVKSGPPLQDQGLGNNRITQSGMADRNRVIMRKVCVAAICQMEHRIMTPGIGGIQINR